MAHRANITAEVDPISRIEGHLGVKLTTNASGVSEADVHGNLWRGFENFLIGRAPNDAITFTQRICGVCPLPHATASTFAVEAALGYNTNFVTYMAAPGAATGPGVPEKALHIRNLVYAAEFLMSHITHFYHLAAPSYVQGPPIPPWTPYFNDSFYVPALRSAGKTVPVKSAGFSSDVWSAVITQYVKALRIRRLTFEAGALFAGRMPMTSSFVAGGVTYDKSDTLAESAGSKLAKFRALIQEVGTFIAKEYVPLVLALGALYTPYDNSANGGSGFGGGYGNFLSWGAFPQPDDTLALAGGFKLSAGSIELFHTKKGDTNGTAAGWPKTFDGVANIASASAMMTQFLREHVTHSHYSTAGVSGYAGNVGDPSVNDRTVPYRNNDGGTKYSWLKAPRFNGHPMEVGPFARLVVNGLYPVNGTPIRSSALSGVYTQYVYADTASGHTGLDTRMVAADLAVALVRAGLAELHTSLDNGASETVVTSANIGTLDEATITAGYGFSNPAGVAIQRAHIMGTVTTWIYDLNGGVSTMDRLRARGLEALWLTIQMIGMFDKTTAGFWPATGGWVTTLSSAHGRDPRTYIAALPQDGSGFGVSEAPRGGLAHFVTVTNGKIAKYQCVVPTTWNASPKDESGARGPIEQAMIGIPFDDAKSNTIAPDGTAGVAAFAGVEALRVAQSFDPCIACAVH